MKKVIISVGLLALSNVGQAAAVEADVQAGRRWAQTEDDDGTHGMKINEVTAAARFSPFANFSVGPSVSFASFDTSDQENSDDMHNLELGLEAKYAVPVNESIVPYAKARWIAYSKGEVNMSNESDDLDIKARLDFRTSGVQLALGNSFALTPKISFNAEVGYGIQMIRMTGGEITKLSGLPANARFDKNIEGDDEESFHSKSLSLGLKVAL